MGTIKGSAGATVQQALMLLTCLIAMVAAAVVNNGRLFGYDPGQVATEQTVTTVSTSPDGSTVINTTTVGKDISGYAGPVPLEIYITDGKITAIKPLKNYESPEFFGKASVLFSRWIGKTPEQAYAMKIDGYTGSTYSSQAIVGNVRAGLNHYLNSGQSTDTANYGRAFDAKAAIALVVVLMAAIGPIWIKNRRYRTIQHLLNVVVLGFWAGSFVSYSLIIGYLSNGVNWLVSLVPLVMLCTAFVYPLLGKKQYYCTHVCPCGSLQVLAGKVRKRKLSLSPRVVRALNRFRIYLWAVVMACLLTGVWADWMHYEIFSAFLVTAAPVGMLIFGAITLIISIWVPMPYCRFVCTTGTLLKFTSNLK